MIYKNPYLKKELKYFLHTFKREPLVISKSKNGFVWDHKGKRYIDFYSGLAVCGVGHNHPNIIRAIQRQSQRVIHTSNFFYTNPTLDCAKELTNRFPRSKVFFSNSGAEANELAIKLARLWASKKGKKGRSILTFSNSFHGRTLGTMAASAGATKVKHLFGPVPPGFKQVPFNDINAFKKAATKEAIAVMIELIQGEGGIRIANPTFVKEVAKTCRKNSMILIVDEIQSGMGRTGTFFAFEQYGLKPDIVTLAKGLAGGLPLGATLSQPPVAKNMVPGYHGSTFGGNPVSCAASLEVLKLLSSQAIRSIRNTGAYLQKKLSRFLQYNSVQSIRGMGLMLAIELKTDGYPYVALARKKGLLINCTQGTVLRFLPPYFMKKSELDRSINILHDVFKNLDKV